MSEDPITIARFELAHEGHLLRMRLAAVGIEAFVIGDHSRHMGMLEPGGQIRVQVRESDVEAALDALSSDDPYGEDQDFPLEELEAQALAAADPVEDIDPGEPEAQHALA